MKRTTLYIGTISAWTLTLLLSACNKAETSSETLQTTPAPAAPSAMEEYRYFMEEAGMAEAEQRVEDAIDYYLSAAEALKNEDPVTEEQADAYARAGDLAYQKFLKEEAVSYYEQAVNVYIKFGGNAMAKAMNTYTNMGSIYKELRNESQARSAWQRALELYEQTPDEHKQPGNKEKVEQNLRDLNQGF